MTNVILQHWSGGLGELEKLSVQAMKEYAEQIGAEHRLLQGDVFMSGLTSPCQKLAFLLEEFDNYEWTVMVDADMFPAKDLKENIFEVPGYGRHYGIQETLVKNLARRFPLLGDPKYPYWGGSIYRFPAHIRKIFRSHLVYSEVQQFSGNYEDEGIMHRLAVRSQMGIGPETYLPKDHWNMSSFEPDLNQARFIHIRPKIRQGGPKRPKIENYRALVEKGILWT
jgi:hypothetical protein